MTIFKLSCGHFVREKHLVGNDIFLTFGIDMVTSLWSDLKATRRLELVIAFLRFFS